MKDNYKHGLYEVLSNELIADSIYKMVISGETSWISRPGQFVNIALEGFYLRRPISICDWSESTITLIYKVVGKGTAVMAKMAAGTKLDLLVGLGNGFDVEACKGKKCVVVGGGVGVPPMYGTAKALKEAGIEVSAVLGFNEAAGAFYKEEFEKLGVPTYVTTVDGSMGIKGFVTDALKDMDFDFYLTCGPGPMLKAVYKMGKVRGITGQLSFEERMGCGFGACMGCTCKTLVGNKRVCTDGPIFSSEEVEL